MIVAALFVDARGAYAGVDGVDLWPESRDARLYPGPYPVVAHPPCSRWCRLAGLVEARWGHMRGDDGGCFASALDSVRQHGGVLEHPAYSAAFAAHGLGRPPRDGGWQREICGGYTCHVEQGRYGHAAKKATWLYAYGTALPEMRWGSTPDSQRTHTVSWCRNRSDDDRPRLGKKQASATPPEFRDLLLSMVRPGGPGLHAWFTTSLCT